MKKVVVSQDSGQERLNAGGRQETRFRKSRRGLQFLVGLFSLLLFLQGCGGGEEQLQDRDVYDSLPPIDTVTYQLDLKDFHAARVARETRGDTHLLPHTRLIRSLPEKVAGYQLEIEDSATFTARRFSWGEAARVFYNEEEDYVEISVADYIHDPLFFETVLERHRLANGLIVDGVKEDRLPTMENGMQFSWKSYTEPARVARAFMGIDYRYFVTIEATGQENTELVLDLLNQVRIEALK